MGVTTHKRGNRAARFDLNPLPIGVYVDLEKTSIFFAFIYSSRLTYADKYSILNI